MNIYYSFNFSWNSVISNHVRVCLGPFFCIIVNVNFLPELEVKKRFLLNNFYFSTSKIFLTLSLKSTKNMMLQIYAKRVKKYLKGVALARTSDSLISIVQCQVWVCNMSQLLPRGLGALFVSFQMHPWSRFEPKSITDYCNVCSFN